MNICGENVAGQPVAWTCLSTGIFHHCYISKIMTLSYNHTMCYNRILHVKLFVSVFTPIVILSIWFVIVKNINRESVFIYQLVVDGLLDFGWIENLFKSLYFIFAFLRYGYHVSNNSYYICHDQAKINKMFARIRNYSGPDTVSRVYLWS